MDNYKLKININPKKLIFSFIIFLFIIFLIVIVSYINTLGKVKVSVEYAPFAAKVQLDGKTIKNHQENYISPGEYRVRVEFENFDTYEDTIVINKDTEYIFGSLIASNEDGTAYLKEHESEFTSINQYASLEANKLGRKQRDAYPIMNKLPIKDPYYTIGYNIPDDNSFNITIKSSISYRQMAVHKLLSILEKDDFDKYDIIFYDLNNPFNNTFKDNNEPNPIQYIKTGFSNISTNFDIDEGTEEGNYYYSYLRYYYNETSAIFRIILIKNENTWKLASDPYPILTTKNTPNIPLDIIYQANQL